MSKTKIAVCIGEAGDIEVFINGTDKNVEVEISDACTDDSSDHDRALARQEEIAKTMHRIA